MVTAHPEREIHVTERDLFKWCRRKHHYSYRLGLTPKHEVRGPMWLGRGMAYALAKFYANGQDPVQAFHDWLGRRISPDMWSNMWEEERKELNGFIDTADAMMEGYPAYAKANDDWDVVDVERPIRVRVPGTYSYLTGTLDLLVRRRGFLWVVDHKTVGYFVESEQLELDDQMTAYLWLVQQEYGETPKGAIYNMLRRKIPMEPWLLKSGRGLSRDKSIDTTPGKYREAIARYGFQESDYSDVLVRLEDNEFYRREPISRNKYELLNFGEQLRAEVQDMTNPYMIPYPYPKRDCTWSCEYKNLCKAQNEGGDVEALKIAGYKVITERQE